MITQEFLSQCTDEQINFGVAWLEAKSDKSNCWRIPYNNMLFKNIINHEFEPCTNPNDIMPIAFANEISLKSCDEYDVDGNIVKQWVAYNGGDYRQVEYKKERSWNANPLRAICEVYILMSVNK